MSGDAGTAAGEDATTADEEPGLFDVDPVWFKIGFYLFLLLWLGYILVETTRYTRFEDTFFPYIIGVPIVILVLLQLVVIRYPEVVDRFKPDQQPLGANEGELQQRIAEATDISSRPKDEKERYELVMLGWVIVLPFMMFYLGLGWTLFLYVFAFTWYFVRDLKLAILVTVIVVVFVQVLFLQFLDMIVLPGEFGLADPLVYIDDFVNDLI